MSAMTMQFQAIDPAMLDKVKPGDRVKFEADVMSGVLIVTRIELVQPSDLKPRQ